MNILLLTSGIEDAARNKNVTLNSHYPLGLGYLHSFLENHGHTVFTLFLNDYPHSACKKLFFSRIKSNPPDVVGFNIITQNRTSSFRLIQDLHKKYPTIHILIGGIHSTIMYKQILRKFPYVIAVLGEGEMTAKELLEKIQAKKSIRNVDGIAYNIKGKIIKTQDRALITDLDLLPFPKHEIFFSDNRTSASMITSRGCPFSCSFCVLHTITRSYPRKRSIQNVIGEIKYLIASFPQLETIWFHDDQFFLINSRVIEFCSEIIKRKIKLKFICSGRFKPISREMVLALEKAGFIQVLFGLESGSPKILKLCRKFITHEDIMKAVTLFKGTKIIVIAFLIVGLYGETNDTINESIAFIQRMQKEKYFYYDDIGILIVYPGTEIYTIAKEAGMINDSYWLTNKPTPLFTVEHTKKELFAYKHHLLDGIALKRIITPAGFLLQYHMIGSIIAFILECVPMSPLYARHLFQRFFPSLYLKTKNLFFKR